MVTETEQVGPRVGISALAILLAVVFLVAATGKMLNFADFLQVINAYQVLPRTVAPLAAVLLVAAEVTTAFALFVPSLRQVGALIAILLLTLFLGAVVWAQATGLRIECGCFGPLQRSEVGFGLIVQDLLLLLMAMTVLRRLGVRRVRSPL